MSNFTEFLAYLQEQVDNQSIYVWGGQGQKFPIVCEKWIRAKETSKKNGNRAVAKWKKSCDAGYKYVLHAYDCSGLGTYFLVNVKKVFPSDLNANGLKGKCAPIPKSQLKKGDWVFRVSGGRAYHVGYVVDNELHVVECMGRDDGVVKRTLNASGASYWNAFGRPKVFKDEIEYNPAPVPTPVFLFTRLLKYTKPYMRDNNTHGKDVTELQKLLAQNGFAPGSIDGVFGKNTRAAVKAAQKKYKLKQDGIAGKNTISALGGLWGK